MRRTPLIRRQPLRAVTPIRPKIYATGNPCNKCGLSSGGFTVDVKKRTCDECIKLAVVARGGRIKTGPVRSEAHLRFIRKLPCCCNRKSCDSAVEAHHVRTAGNSGTGIKPSDLATVPLCATHHRELHRLGIITFQAKYEVDLANIAVMCAAATTADVRSFSSEQ